MICATLTAAPDGSIVFTPADCTATGAYALKTPMESGGFFDIPLDAAPGLLAASLPLLIAAFSCRIAIKGVWA